jgi:hypothetical protein
MNGDFGKIYAADFPMEMTYIDRFRQKVTHFGLAKKSPHQKNLIYQLIRGILPFGINIAFCHDAFHFRSPPKRDQGLSRDGYPS